MRTILSSWLLLMACVEVSIQQCTIKGSMSKIKDRLSSITDAMITINSTYYNCLSRSDTSDHYSSMSVSILYIRSGDPNNTHEVRYNLQCNNGVWEIVGNQSTALRNNNTRYCEDCIDQTVNKYRCTSYAIGHHSASTNALLDKKHLMKKRQIDGCDNAGIDLVFVLDGSGSVGSDRFQMIREFTMKIANSLTIGSQDSLVGVIVFSSSASIHFSLLQHTNATTLEQALNSIPYPGGVTDTAEALQLLLSSAQNGRMGIRDGHPHIAIVVTDGLSSNGAATLADANALHAANIYQVYAAGLGNANLDELNAIASDPSLVFFTNEFNADSVADLTGNFTQMICQEQTCQLLVAPDNGMINCSLGDDGQASLGDTCTVTCNSGYELSGNTSRSCQINGNWSGTESTCTQDDCDPNPCMNNGTCTDGVNSFTCNCVDGFTGENCTTNIDDCDPNPCMNNGTCQDGVNSFTCNCVDGFTGENCTTNIDDCDPNPCMNNGTCIDGVNSFTCNCVDGFTGENCATNIDDCDPNPCMNNGTCTDGVNSFTCDCVDAFTGENCITNIDDCDPNPCTKGSTCTDGINSFTCNCVDGLTGDQCENGLVGCQPEVDSIWNITWPPTEVGKVATRKCPGGNEVTGYVNRTCLLHDQWGLPDVLDCQRVEQIRLELRAEELSLVDSLQSDDDQREFGDIVRELANITNSNQPIFPYDLCSITATLDIIIELVQLHQDDLVQSFIREILEYAIDILDSLVDERNDASYEQLNSRENSCISIGELLYTTEQVGILLSTTLESSANQTVRDTLTGRENNIGIEAQIPVEQDLMENGNIEFYAFRQSSDAFTVFGNRTPSYLLPHAVIINQINKTGTRVPVISSVIRNSPVFNNQSTRIESLILSVQISTDDPRTRTSLGNETIIMSFNIGMPGDRPRFNARCVFFDYLNNRDLSGYFSTDGVTLITSNSTFYQCSSNHLTSFAVLVDVSGDGSESEALSIVSYIGCVISIICLSIAVIAFIGLRERVFNLIQHFVHLNLSVALLLGHIAFISGIKAASEYRASCLTVAILLHYLFMAAFSWMLCEGMLLFIMIKFVFYHGFLKRKLFFVTFGWGLPIPIVAASAALFHEQYGINDRCWISEERGAIWGFVGPMLLIIMVNSFFLIITMHEVCKSNRDNISTEKVTAVATVKSLLKTAVIITPILGCTWVIGLLAINENTAVFAWAFTILNSLQGVCILILYVLRNEKFMKKMKMCGTRCYNRNTSSLSTSAKTPNLQKEMSPYTKATTHDSIGDPYQQNSSHYLPPSYVAQNDSNMEHDFQTTLTCSTQGNSGEGLNNSIQE
ncbi:adhesion G protein-coupled receptor E2-like [Dysidea avara]|uniref:adhesion G protein-coupled receptor E2-like n=1 Tax=Dysidea avara TaxID=196820 RepID=UPI003325C8C6